MEHNHVPYACILIQACQLWRKDHAGNLPKTFSEKKQFSDMIKSMRRIGLNQEGKEVQFNGENFDEAIKVATDCWKSESVSDSIKQIIEDQKCEKPTNEFWLFSAALKKFV